MIRAMLALVATVIGPGIILNAVKQPEPAQTYAYSDSFYESYDEIRVHLQELTADLGVEISSYAIDETDGLFIDSFYLPSTDAYDYGCYESYTSVFAKGTAENLQVRYVEMLESLK